MTGAIAEAYYGIDVKMMLKAISCIPKNLQGIYYAFRNQFVSTEN